MIEVVVGIVGATVLIGAQPIGIQVVLCMQRARVVRSAHGVSVGVVVFRIQGTLVKVCAEAIMVKVVFAVVRASIDLSARQVTISVVLRVIKT